MYVISIQVLILSDFHLEPSLTDRQISLDQVQMSFENNSQKSYFYEYLAILLNYI